jgi:conjugal transfer pilus assembly protein TrbC
MRRHLFIVGTAAFTGLLVGLAAASGAQTVDGLDLAKVRARARLSPQEAEALTSVVARRGEALRREAADNAASARAAAARYASAKTSGDPATTFDFDGMVAATAKQMVPEDAPRLVAFASLSMPSASLKAMIADVAHAGGVVVFRGLPGNSAKTFTTALAKVLPPGEVKAAVGIDPRLFRAFGVEAVPAYVVTATDFDLCDGFECRTTLPPHDRMDGNVTLAHALDTFARGDGPGARVAALYRARLGEAQ